MRRRRITAEKINTFEELEQEIIKTGKCCACGACVAYCTSQGFNVIEMDDYTPKYISKKNIDNCTECGVCYYICPNTQPLMDKLNKIYCIEDEIGPVISVKAVKTTNEQIKEIGQDGGFVTTLLKFLFETDEIDAAIVSEHDENFKPIPKIIFNNNDLLKSAGTRYSISSNILPLKDLYNISEEFLHKKHILDIDELRLAFIGTPCQCRAIRKMNLLSISPTFVVKYVIGLFCFENFDYTELFKILQAETNIPPADVIKTQIKKNFFLTSKDKEVVEVDIKKLEKAVRTHCHECDEFTGRFADLSVGGSGAPDGYSMVIAKTQKGQELVKTLIINGFIEEYSIPDGQYREWQTKKLTWFKKMISIKTKSN